MSKKPQTPKRKKVVNVSFKLSGDTSDFQMTAKQIKDYVQLQIQDEEAPFTLSAIRVEVENQQ